MRRRLRSGCERDVARPGLVVRRVSAVSDAEGTGTLPASARPSRKTSKGTPATYSMVKNHSGPSPISSCRVARLGCLMSARARNSPLNRYRSMPSHWSSSLSATSVPSCRSKTRYTVPILPLPRRRMTLNRSVPTNDIANAQPGASRAVRSWPLVYRIANQPACDRAPEARFFSNCLWGYQGGGRQELPWPATTA